MRRTSRKISLAPRAAKSSGMTPEKFRRLALSFDGAFESAHMNHPDFRAAGRIFATLGYPEDNLGMVKLTSEQQSVFVAKSPRSFTPCNGAWGRAGCTNVHIPSVTATTLRAALTAAWRNAVSQTKRRNRSAA